MIQISPSLLGGTNTSELGSYPTGHITQHLHIGQRLFLMPLVQKSSTYVFRGVLGHICKIPTALVKVFVFIPKDVYDLGHRGVEHL